MARRDKDKSKDTEAKSDAPTDDHSEAEPQSVGTDAEVATTRGNPPTDPARARTQPGVGAPTDIAAHIPAASDTPELRASRTPTATMTMPFATNVGKPPDMPRETAPPPLALGAVEDPTHMPGPKDVPAGDPDDAAPPPGRVPPGDSRSLRRHNEFALVYRVGTCVITRTGVVGTRGQWRVVEYPTSSTASSSYARECSRFVSEGFSDYRD